MHHHKHQSPPPSIWDLVGAGLIGIIVGLLIWFSIPQ